MVGTGYMQYGPSRALLEAINDNADTEEIESLIAQGAYIGRSFQPRSVGVNQN